MLSALTVQEKTVLTRRRTANPQSPTTYKRLHALVELICVQTELLGPRGERLLAQVLLTLEQDVNILPELPLVRRTLTRLSRIERIPMDLAEGEVHVIVTDLVAVLLHEGLENAQMRPPASRALKVRESGHRHRGIRPAERGAAGRTRCTVRTSC